MADPKPGEMILYDDIEPTEKVRVYDKGVTANRVGDREADYQTLVSYRTGDVWAPRLDATEALRYVVAEFLDSIRSNAIRILGPAPAPLERIKHVHRHQLLIKSSSRAALHHMLERLQAYIEEKKVGATRVIIDVDPVSLL